MGGLDSIPRSSSLFFLSFKSKCTIQKFWMPAKSFDGDRIRMKRSQDRACLDSRLWATRQRNPCFRKSWLSTCCLLLAFQFKNRCLSKRRYDAEKTWTVWRVFHVSTSKCGLEANPNTPIVVLVAAACEEQNSPNFDKPSSKSHRPTSTVRGRGRRKSAPGLNFRGYVRTQTFHQIIEAVQNPSIYNSVESGNITIDSGITLQT
jgi:hypothetical protein